MDGKQGIFGNQAGGLWAWDLQRMWPSNSSLENSAFLSNWFILIHELHVRTLMLSGCIMHTHCLAAASTFWWNMSQIDGSMKEFKCLRHSRCVSVICMVPCQTTSQLHSTVLAVKSGHEINWILSVDRGCFQLHLKETCWVNARNCCVDHLKYRRNAKANGLAWWIRIQEMTPIGEFPSKKRPCSHKVHIFVLSLRVPCGVGTSARDKACQSWSDSKVLSMWNYSVLI